MGEIGLIAHQLIQYRISSSSNGIMFKSGRTNPPLCSTTSLSTPPQPELDDPQPSGVAFLGNASKGEVAVATGSLLVDASSIRLGTATTVGSPEEECCMLRSNYKSKDKKGKKAEVESVGTFVREE